MTLPNTNGDDLHEVHCVGCGRFVALAAIAVGTVQILCPKCKKWTTVSSWPDSIDNSEDTRYNGGKVK